MINETLKLLIPALILVESNGNDGAVGDQGRSIGCLQIQEAVIEDVNGYFGTEYLHEDALNRDHAVTICNYYLTRFGTRYHQKMGREPSTEVLARMWNGGPIGWSKLSTLKYWERVKKILKAQGVQYIP